MKHLRTRFERFCYANRHKGIPNLMLYIAVGTAIVYLVGQMAGNYALYAALCFHRESILHGQLWRLITYPLTYGTGNSNLILIAISLFQEGIKNCKACINSLCETLFFFLNFSFDKVAFFSKFGICAF